MILQIGFQSSEECFTYQVYWKVFAAIKAAKDHMSGTAGRFSSCRVESTASIRLSRAPCNSDLYGFSEIVSSESKMVVGTSGTLKGRSRVQSEFNSVMDGAGACLELLQADSCITIEVKVMFPLIAAVASLTNEVCPAFFV